MIPPIITSGRNYRCLPAQVQYSDRSFTFISQKKIFRIGRILQLASAFLEFIFPPSLPLENYGCNFISR